MLRLAQLSPGQSAKVISIEGGRGLRQKLQNLGIREGAVVKRERGMFTFGPIIVKAGSTQIALGRGMASKVMVELS